MPGTYYETNELQCVEQLRHRLKDVMNKEMYEDTHLFIRFLRARNCDLQAAENMLRNHIEWRAKFKIDSIHTWYIPQEVFKKYVGLNSIGLDKDESLVRYMNIGNLDFRGMLNSCKPIDAVHFIVSQLESDLKIFKSESKNRYINNNQWIYVLNLENFSLSTATHKPTVEVLKDIITVYDANYPELLKNAYVINASWYFQIIWSLLKPVLSGKTLQKIKIFGRDGWKEELLKQIDAETLPAFLGGKVTDPDGNPLCTTFITQGGLVPEKYYAINNRVNFSIQPGVKKLTVNRLSKEQVELQVLYPDSIIEWEFEAKGKDIAMSLLYKEFYYSDLREIIPKQRFDTSISTEVGVFKCDKLGYYYLEFDNRYSWIHHKEVYYKAEVITSDKQNNTRNKED